MMDIELNLVNEDVFTVLRLLKYADDEVFRESESLLESLTVYIGIPITMFGKEHFFEEEMALKDLIELGPENIQDFIVNLFKEQILASCVGAAEKAFIVVERM